MPNKFVCTFRQTVYGISGNELGPPRSLGTYTYTSQDNETLAQFKVRMQAIGMHMRGLAAAQPRRAYSDCDSWDWSFSEIRNIENVY